MRRRRRARLTGAGRRRYFRRRLPRRPRFRNHRVFHVRFETVMTTDWPTTTHTDPSTGPVPLKWNFDHLVFRLDKFMQVHTPEQHSYQHLPPFRYYDIRKIVVKAKWINWPEQYMENMMGCTALDLDGEDSNRGNVTHSRYDPPNEAHVDHGPFSYDPLQNRSTRKHWNFRSGFTRVFRPKPDISGLPHVLFRGRQWVSVREGSGTNWHGLSISCRQTRDLLNETVPRNLNLQYTITAYVAFKDFDYETGSLLQ